MLILIAASLLRLWNYSGWSLSNDELSALSRLQFPSFSEVMKNGVMMDDMHPPGVQAFLYILTSIAGNDVWVVRLPFVIMGILSVIVFFFLADKWISRNGALAASAVFASLIFPILYSQLARPYSPGLLFSLLSVYFLTSILYDDNGEKKTKIDLRNITGLILCGAACMYSHYFSFMFLGIAGITGVFLANPRIRIALFISAVLMFLLYIPTFKIFIYHFSIGGLGGTEGWLGKPGADAFIQFVFYIFNDSPYLSALFILLLVIFIALHFKTKTKTHFRWISMLLFLLPFAIAYFYSIYKNPVYQHSIMLFSFPYLLIFIFSYFPKLDDAKSSIIIISILVITTLSTTAERKFYSTNYFSVFKELAQHADKTGKKYGNDNITFTSNVIKPFYIKYYHEKLNLPVKYSIFSCYTPEGLGKLNEEVQHSENSYLSYSWSNTANLEETEYVIRDRFPYLVESVDYFNSGYRLYTNKRNEGLSSKVNYTFIESFDENILGIDTGMIENKVVRSGKHSLHFSPSAEFGPGFKKTVNEVSFKAGQTLKVSAWIYFNEIPAEGNLVLQIDDNNKNIYWKGTILKPFITKPKQWIPVFTVHKVTKKLSASSVISAYVWNAAKKDFFVEDFKVEILD